MKKDTYSLKIYLLYCRNASLHILYPLKKTLWDSSKRGLTYRPLPIPELNATELDKITLQGVQLREV